ncbi:MAG TPA: hypothetical protein VGA08_00150 [Candidatus Saccharimonadales bacterium]
MSNSLAKSISLLEEFELFYETIPAPNYLSGVDKSTSEPKSQPLRDRKISRKRKS